MSNFKDEMDWAAALGRAERAVREARDTARESSRAIKTVRDGKLSEAEKAKLADAARRDREAVRIAQEQLARVEQTPPPERQTCWYNGQEYEL